MSCLIHLARPGAHLKDKFTLEVSFQIRPHADGKVGEVL